MDGSARFTIDRSRKTMNWPTHRKARITPGRKPTAGSDLFSVGAGDVKQGSSTDQIWCLETVRSTGHHETCRRALDGAGGGRASGAGHDRPPGPSTGRWPSVTYGLSRRRHTG